MAKISLIVNGNPVNANVGPPHPRWCSFCAKNLRLIGTYYGCDTLQCAPCVVHLDGMATKSCTTLAVMADGHEVKTIEGLAADGAPLHPMQEAFREHHGLQCGFCTPGMIMTAVDLVHRKGHDLSDRFHLAKSSEGNLCRCTGLPEYRRIDRRLCQGDGEIRSRLSFFFFFFFFPPPPAIRNLSCTNSNITVRRLCGRPPIS